MIFEEKSLSLKLLFVVGALFILMSVGYMGVTTYSLSNTEKVIVTDVGEEVSKQIEDTLRSKTDAIAEKISNLFSESFSVPNKLAQQITSNIEGDIDPALSRDQVENIVKNTLKYSGTSSIYAQFEANAFDGRDDEYKQGYKHSVAGYGSFEVYFVRENNGEISQEVVESPDEKHDTTLDEYGFRAAEWYLCAKDNNEACASNPYNYEIRPGYSELMTSLVVPVVAQGSFRGVVGADLNLPILQQMAKELKSSLYKGNSKVFIVSQSGFLAAATEHEESLAKPFKKVFDNSQSLLALSGKEKSTIIDNYLYVVRPIKISTANVEWQLVVGIDVNTAMLPVDNVSAMISDEVDNILRNSLIVAVILIVIALLLIQLFTRSIVRPVEMVADRMSELAGQGGDLTQAIEVQSHAELINLSHGFNQFREKVRGLLEQAKQSGYHVMELSEESKDSAQKTHQHISTQQSEVNTIVTAITEMSATAQEVAHTASSAADNATAATESVRETESEVSVAATQATELSTEIGTASEAVKAVSVRSDDIKKILDVIGVIAEQTNLLALNAAIEAARAGDHGRGFSVVADEVRALASKTADSVDEISQVISALQNEVSTTVDIIEKGSIKADNAATCSNGAFEKMQETVKQIDEINQHILQIAAAAEEQSQVAEELNKNMVVVGDATNEVAILSEASEASSIDIHKSAHELIEFLNKLKTS
ncbi:methyl-accepting chemotaxis protein [Thalassotalea sp. G2M2-11]|uniref:methyl-accepting chemotaxis protein n=1 Tax=Thalassotalea sp. G2M2-11 TaxID=2787627 RepID=UPI001F495F91|nr:methyl-accepting chemotaxis protein [Thalassotalea sp. G2M2-11]